MDFSEKIKNGMKLIAKGCMENEDWSKCEDCPFDGICDVLVQSGMVEPSEWRMEEMDDLINGMWEVYEVANTDEEQPIAWKCPNCDEVVEVKYNFCPECGMDMRGEAR